MSSESIAYHQDPQEGPAGMHAGHVANWDEAETTKMLANDDTEREEPTRVYLRKITLAAFVASMVFAVICIIAGAVLSTSTHMAAGSSLRGFIPVLSSSPNTIQVSAIGLIFSIIATIFTEIIGFVHSTSLRSSLIAEHRLDFNTNTRLFTAANKMGWASPNGRLMNALMALLLVMSYASSALVVMRLQVQDEVKNITKYQPAFTAPPIIVLGIYLFLQGVIALFGVYRCGPDLLENTSVLDTTKKQIERRNIDPRKHRCMRNVLQGRSTTSNPIEPLARQPSAWSANPTVKMAAIAVWCLIPVYTVWGAIVYALSIYASDWISKAYNERTFSTGSRKLSESSWALFPNDKTRSFSIDFWASTGDKSSSFPWAAWPLMLLALMVIQSGLTLALHYCEAIINTTRDEQVWRQATGGRGVAISKQGPLKAVLGSWRSVSLLITKPFLHWMFGLSFNSIGIFWTHTSTFEIAITTNCVQTWYLSIALAGFATFTTLVATYNPRGPQPAAYGHFQTLADLIDEWPPVLYWGHKWDKDDVCHAGTSDQPLPPVEMGRMYAG